VAGTDLDVHTRVGGLQRGGDASIARQATIRGLEVQDERLDRTVGAHFSTGHRIDDVPNAQAVGCQSLREVAGLPLRPGNAASLDVQRCRAREVDRDVGGMLPRHGALLYAT
jgi:hypothetical protein